MQTNCERDDLFEEFCIKEIRFTNSHTKTQIIHVGDAMHIHMYTYIL